MYFSELELSYKINIFYLNISICLHIVKIVYFYLKQNRFNNFITKIITYIHIKFSDLLYT